MVALTLREWCNRTLEQVHFAAKAALDAGVVQGDPRIRECVAATATGDLRQCLAQGPNIDSVRRITQVSLSRFMICCVSNKRRHHEWPVYGLPTCRSAPRSSWI